MVVSPAALPTGSRRPGHAAWLAIAACAAATLWLWFKLEPWPVTPDGSFHLQRSRALAEALRQGVLYPRWFPDFAFGYGYPVLHYYAPAFYYLPALLHLTGLELPAATRLGLALVYGLSGLAAYAALRTFVVGPAALAGALLYLAFPYRLYDLWVRGALPEFAAFLWPPLLLYFSILLLRRPEDSAPHALRDRPYPALRSPPALGLALSWAGLILTHNLSALMAGTLAAASIPLVAALPGQAHLGDSYARRLFQVALRLGLPVLWGGLLSAFYSLPALVEARWVGLGATPASGGYTAHFAAWTGLVQSALRYIYPAAADPAVALPVYALPLLALGALVTIWPGRRRGALLFALAVALVTLWLTTRSSALLWEVAAPLLGKLQFPWRWQALLALALAVVLALVVDEVITLLEAHSFRQGGGLAAWLAVGALGLLAFAYAAALPNGAAGAPSGTEITVSNMWAFDAAQGQVGATWTGEFLPRWVSAPRWTLGRAPDALPPSLPPVELKAAPAAVKYLDAGYRVEAGQPLTLTLDRFYFPAWTVLVDGAVVPAAPQGPLGLLSAPLAAGEHQVTIAWRATPAVWSGRAVSALGWALVGLALAGLSRPWRRWALAVWAAVALLSLVGMSGLTTRSSRPQPVAADFGPVRLEGAAIEPAQAGAVAPIQLYWTVTAPAPDLVAFVHLLGPDGAVVAQWDEPLATPFRPPSRWQPGLLMRHPLPVPLSAALAEGDYPVVAGLYPAGQADAPLAAAESGETRVPVGVLTVRR
jgi:hypothetical protein